jgi:hypothetical protein
MKIRENRKREKQENTARKETRNIQGKNKEEVEKDGETGKMRKQDN